MEATNPHLRLASISSAYSCNSNTPQSGSVSDEGQVHTERFNQVHGFVNTNNFCNQNQVPQQQRELEQQTGELNSHGDHQRVSTLTKMNNCMTNSTLNSVSTDPNGNFSHATNVNHNQPGNNIQYGNGPHHTNITSVQYNTQHQQSKDQHLKGGQYSGELRQIQYPPNINRIEQLQQLEQQQQQLNYQHLVQQHAQQQLSRNQNQIQQQILVQQQGQQFPQTLNTAQQQYLLQQRYQQQQQQQQANLQQQIAYQQHQQQYLASQNSYDGANSNQTQANQQALLQQQLAYQQHLHSQQEVENSNEQGVKQEVIETQQAFLQQIAFQQQNIKAEANTEHVKQDATENRNQQNQSAYIQQITYQQPTSVEQGNQNLKQESFEQTPNQPVQPPHHIAYQQQLLIQQQNLKSESNNLVEQPEVKPEPNQILQQQIAYQANNYKSEHVSQFNKEIAVQNQLILQQQLIYQQQQLLAQQQQNSGKRESINPVFLPNSFQTSKPESNGTITAQQAFIQQQQQLAYQQLLSQQQSSSSSKSHETQFQPQSAHQLKQETVENASENQQSNINQQIEIQQHILKQQQQQHQQPPIKVEPSDISQKPQEITQELVEQNLIHQLHQQQAALLKQEPSISGKSESLPLQHNIRPQFLPQQVAGHPLLSGHSVTAQFAPSLLTVTREVQQVLPGQPLPTADDSQRQVQTKVDPLLGTTTPQLLPGQICQVLPNGQKIITNQSLSIAPLPNVGSAAANFISVESENGQTERSNESESSVAPGSTPLSKIRVVPYGKVLTAPTVQSEQSEKSSSGSESGTAAAGGFGKPFIRVPLLWKRLIANSMVIYVSPSNTALSSMDQVKAYLQTQGTCKCGLECPLQCDSVFSFDAKVASKPWSPTEFQESPLGAEFNKLCNHKRKHMTMMGLEPELPLDPKRLDGPDFRKKRKVYAGPYSSGTGPRKPRMSKEPTSTVVANPTPWNDSTPQQPPPIVLQTPPQPQQSLPTLPPPPSASADLPVIATQQPAGPRMFNPRMTMLTSQQQTQLMQQAQLDQQRMFRYQPQQTMQTQAVQQTQLNQHVQQSLQVQTQQPQLSQQRVYQGTPPTMLGSEQMYTTNGAYAKQSIEASPSQKPEESQGQSVQIQHMPQQQQQGLQPVHTQSQLEGMDQQAGQSQPSLEQQGQLHQLQMSQVQAMQVMQQQVQMQAQLAQQIQQQAVSQQTQQLHPSQGVPSSQQPQQQLQQLSAAQPQQQLQQLSSDHMMTQQMSNNQQLQQQLQQQLSQQQQLQQQQQSSNQQQQQQMQQQMQMQAAQLAQMQQMQQQYHRQAQVQQSHPSHQPTSQYQAESAGNQMSSDAAAAHFAKFPGQGQTLPDSKIQLVPQQQQYRQPTSYPVRAPYESFPPSNYPPEGGFESLTCDSNPYQTNTNQSISTGPGASAYHVPQPQPVFNYQRQNTDLQTNVQAVQPTQRPTPPWQQTSRPTTPSNPTPPSPYERVPPLHPTNVQNTLTPASYNPTTPEPAASVVKKRTKTVTKSPNTSKKQATERQETTETAYPSFMDDPSGYLAQQTALLNSTISKQCDIRVSSDMLENKNLHRIARRYNSSEGGARIPDSSDTIVERIKTPNADLKGPIQGGTVSTSNRSPGGILVPPDASSPRSTSSMNSNNSPQPYSTPSSPGPKSPERQPRSMPVASGHTVSSNTITSVVAGRSNTSLTSAASPPQPEVHIPVTLHAKSPLEMVQSVVSSIQVPQARSPSVSVADVKVSTSLPSHIFVSSNGQLIVASQPQPLKSSPSLVSVNTSTASSSSLMTNVTGAISQVIPSLGLNQQVLGQPTVLVNMQQAPLLFQPNIMTMDNLNSVQIPQLTVSSPLSTDSGAFSPRSSQGMISPESAKRKMLKANKQRKVSPQKVTSMLLTPQQGSSTGAGTVVMQPQQTFAQPMLQTLILPNKGNFNNQLIATSIQPLNLVQQFPTIQQFLVPAGLGGLGGMAVMSQDGTTTLLQDAVHLNVLTPVQTSGMFGGQSILTSPNSMVIRSPNTSGTVRPSTSTGQGSFITTNSQNQLIVNNPFANQLQGQLSPIITNLSPNSQQISFTSPTSQRQSQEYIQCGQTLIPITSQQSNNTSSGSGNQNSTVLQQNAALMQQQMSLLQQANQEQSSQNFIINEAGNKTQNFIINDGSNKTQNFIITTSDKQPGSTNYILSPKSDAKSPGAQTHFILNTSDSKSPGSSFIITNPTESKQILTSGNFILTSDKTNSGNLILSTAPQQQQQQDKAKLVQQTQQQQIQQITQQQLQQLQQNSQLQQLQQAQQLQQSQQIQQAVQQLQQQQQHQHRLNMSTQTSVNAAPSSTSQLISPSPITIYVSQAPSSASSNLYTSTSSGNLLSSSSSLQQSGSATTSISSSAGLYAASSTASSVGSVYGTISSSGQTSSIYTISSTGSSSASVYTSSPPDTTTLSPIEAGGAPSPCHSLEVSPSPLGLPDENHPSPTSTSVHLVSSSNTDWSDPHPDGDGFATPKPSPRGPSTASTTGFVKSSSKDFVESSSSPPSHRSYSRTHHHSHHHHRSHSHHHHQSSSSSSSGSKHHHSKPPREHHSDYSSHRSDSSRHHNSHVTNIPPDDGSDSDHSNDSDDMSVATTTKLLGLSEGDLVWGQVKGYPSWPGKLISPAPTQGRVWVKWFGMSNEPLSEVEPTTLKSLSQGLEAHHRSRKKLRKSRKLNTQLENAIQEAMAELDRMSETPQQSRPLPPAVAASGGKSKR